MHQVAVHACRPTECVLLLLLTEMENVGLPLTRNQRRAAAKRERYLATASAVTGNKGSEHLDEVGHENHEDKGSPSMHVENVYTELKREKSAVPLRESPPSQPGTEKTSKNVHLVEVEPEYHEDKGSPSQHVENVHTEQKREMTAVRSRVSPPSLAGTAETGNKGNEHHDESSETEDDSDQPEMDVMLPTVTNLPTQDEIDAMVLSKKVNEFGWTFNMFLKYTGGTKKNINTMLKPEHVRFYHKEWRTMMKLEMEAPSE